MAVREVPWPRDVAALARSLAESGAWYWLDGGAVEPDGSRGRSHLGAAREVRHAVRGREREFLSELRDGIDTGAAAGWVIALGYEFGVALMGLDPLPDDAAPGFALRRGTELVLDHASGTAELRGDDATELDVWLDDHGAALRSAVPADPASGIGSGIGAGRAEAVPGTSPAEYEVDVEACLAAIRDGDAYVLCLTDTSEVRGAFDPLGVYLRLREEGGHGPALRGAVIVAGERALVSTSPERFLSVRDGWASTHPIKGTRPRGHDDAADRILAADLLADPKERAENLMIVDLMRNDLSRFCVPGTVAAAGVPRVESHPGVHQLVSTVRGRIGPGRDALDALEACFPGGSMTGAPKRSAVEILAQLEGAARGLYSGCFGWIGGSERRVDRAELAMTIRSIELRGIGSSSASVARVGAGGGVTIDSDPARERAEKDLKAAPLLAALFTDRPRGSHLAER